MVSPYLTWWLEEQEREAREIEKAKQLRKLRITEASLVDRGACPGAAVTFFKRAGAMYDKGDELESYLRELEPGLSYGTALAKHVGDPVVQDLYERQRYDKPEAPPVQKAEQWEPSAWGALEKVAARLRAEDSRLTEAASVAEAYRLRPDLG